MDIEDHERSIKSSEEFRDNIAAESPAYYNEAYALMSRVLRRYDHQKYLIFKYQAFDPGIDLDNINIALSMAAHFLEQRDDGYPIDHTYITSFILSYTGISNFVIFPGGKDTA